MIRLWDVPQELKGDTTEPRAVLKGHTNGILALTFSPDGKLLYSAGYDMEIHVWDLAEKKEVAKPRSGRPITPRALNAALAGGPISGPSKQRILRAVNYLLEQKKKDKVELKALF